MKTWYKKVQEVYTSLDELKSYDDLFGVVDRCGFNTAQEMWDANPLIGGSTNPTDFGIATPEDLAAYTMRPEGH